MSEKITIFTQNISCVEFEITRKYLVRHVIIGAEERMTMSDLSVLYQKFLELYLLVIVTAKKANKRMMANQR